MKRARFLSITALVVIGLCILVYRSVRTAVEDSAADPSARPAIARAAPPERSRSAESPPALARAGAHAPPRSTDGAKPEPPETVVRDPRSDPEARAELLRKRREYMAGVDADFRKEAVDRAWSSSTSAVVQSAFAADSDLGPLARGVECRSRTCRVEVADDGSGQLDKLLPLFAQRVAHDLPTAVIDHVDQPGGTARVVLYMARGEPTQAMAP